VSTFPRAWARILGLIALCLTGSNGELTAQVVRAFGNRFTANATGDILIVGNTAMSCDSSGVNGVACSSARNGFGSLLNNNDFKSRHLDVDADPTTFNSSSATLTIPAGATVLWAGLYWGGDVAAQGAGGTAAPDAAFKDRVTLVTPAAGPVTVVATEVDLSGSDYGAFRDVTALVQAGGSGSYTVGNIQAGAGIDKYAGWGLVVVIQDPTEPLRNLTVFDGYAKVFRSSVTIPVSGFTTPLSGPVTTRIGSLAYEGDRAFVDDQILLDGTPLADALNPATNFFSATNTRLGLGISSRNPGFVNLMGLDADVVNATGLLANGATSATMTMASADDEYYPAALTFVTDLHLAADVAATVSGPATAAPGTNVTYTISVTNTGPIAASNVVVTDTLPATATFVSATAGGVAAGQVVTWPTIPSLAVGATVTFTLTVTMPASGTLLNLVATTAATADLVPGNNDGSASTSRVTTLVQPLADLTVSLTGPSSIGSGGLISYLVTVTNTGPNSAANVVVTDTLPSGVSFVSATGSGTLSGSVVTWPVIASLASGASVSFTVVVTAPATGSLVNLAAAASTTTDPNPTDNDGSAAASRVTTTVIGTADVVVTVAGAAIVNAGGSVTYTVTILNNGPVAATGIVVTDTLPGTATFVSASNGGVRSGLVVTWPTIATLASGASVSYTVVVTAPASGTITNVAAATTTTNDPTPANNDGSGAGRASTTIAAVADLSVTKTGPAFVVAGGTVSYLITLRNNGPNTAANIVVTDTLPAGVAFVSATGGGTESGGVVTWPAIPTLTNGALRNFTVVVTGPATGSFTNLAAAAATTADLNLTNNNGSAAASRVTSTVSAAADLVVTKTGPTSAAAGTNVVYTITVTNNGPNPAPTVVLRDSLPATGTFQGATGGASRSGRLVTWPTIASLASGASQSFTVTWRAPGTGTITNLAFATAATGDPDPTNNDGSAATSRVVTTITTAADVQTTQTGPSSIVASGLITYLITTVNNGPNPATNVVITDTLPAGVGFVSASNGGTLVGNVITWPTIASMANGASVTYTVVVTGPATGSVTNVVASTATTPDAAPTNNDGSAAAARVTTTVGAPADLAVTKTGPTTAFGGDTLVYTIAVTNNGPNPATGVVVTDTMPIGTNYLSSSAGGTRVGRVVTWPTVASLAVGATQTYLVRVRTPASGTVINVAAATATTGDPNPADNDGSAPTGRVTTVVAASADVQVTQTGPAIAAPNGTITYTIVVRNNGLSAATGVVLTDTLPAGVTFVSATGGGTAAAGVVTWPTIASLANGATQTFTVTATAPTSGTFTAIAAAVGTLPDQVPANNDGSAAAARVTTTVATTADVVATVSGPGAVPSLGTFNYTVTLTNAGPSPAVNVVLTDTLPATVTLVSTTGGGTAAAGVITWPTVPLLAAGASLTYTVTVTAPVAGAFVNVVAATAATTDGDLTNNDGSPPNGRVTTTVAPVADVVITKTGPGTVLANGTVNYTITISNNGPSTATGVVVIDSLPPGVTNVIASDGGVYGEGILVWPAIANLPVGSTVTYTVSARAPEVGPLVNIVAGQSTTADPDPTNNDGSTGPGRVITDVIEVADVVTTKTGPATAAPGSAITYTITVTNNGPSPASNVVITDTLPGAVTFVSASNGGTVAGGVVTWPTIPTLPIGSSVVYTVVVTAPTATATFTAITASTASTLDPDATNNDGSAGAARVTTVVAALVADISVTKSGPASVAPGGTLNYTVVVRNGGPDAAAGVVVTDTLPVGVTFVSASAGGTVAGRVVTWPAIATLAAGATQSLTVVATAPTSGGPLVNVAAATSTTSDPVPGNNDGSAATARVTTVLAPPTADVAVTKTGATTVLPNGTVAYTIVASNSGPGTAAAVVVTDTLPAGVSVVSVSHGATLSGSVLTWPAVSLPPGSAITYALVVRAPTTGSSFTNVVAATSPTPDPNPTNNDGSASTARVTTTITPTADLVASKVGPATATPGAPVTYAITVRNDGPAVATDVVVTDTLPAGATFLSASDGGTVANGVVTWPLISTLANGASVQYAVTIAAPTAGSMVNVVAARASSVDPNPANNNGTAGNGRSTTSIQAQADLVATKTGPGTAVIGETVTYTITVTNQGPDAATNVIVTDTLPAGTQFVQASAGGIATGSVVTWPVIPSLANGQAVTVTVSLRPTITGSITNVAAAVASTPDPDPANNDGSSGSGRVVTAVVDRADVVVTKSAPAVVDAGGSLVYTITLTNRGPAPAAAVVVTDTLPSQVTFVSASDGGTRAGRVITWPAVTTLGVGQVITYTVTVTAPLTGSVTNVVAATSSTPDPDPTNNDGSAAPARPTTTVRPVDVALTKSHVGTFTVGTQVNYRLEVRNVGVIATRGPLTVVDTLPTGLRYVGADGAGWTCAAAGQIVTCSYPASLEPAATASFELAVVIQNTAPASLINRAHVATAGDEAPGGNNTGTDAADLIRLSPLKVEKRSTQPEAEIGDLIEYQVDVSNVATAPIPGVVVNDVLPLGFTYVTGTARLAGKPLADPAGGIGPKLAFAIGAVPGNQTVRLSYRLRVGPGATAGTGVNTVQAESPIAGVSSAIATARVRIQGGVFSDRGFIVGKVAIQYDSAGSRRELGIPGVRVLLSDGTAAITDEEGKYSIAGLAAELYVLRVDRTTLPPDIRLSVTDARQVGTAETRFVDLKFGELHRADFVMRDTLPSNAVEAVRHRRGGVTEIVAAIPDTAAVTIPADRTIIQGADVADSAGAAGHYRPVGRGLATSIGERHGLSKVQLAEPADRERPSGTRIAMTVPSGGIPADGNSQVAVKIRLLDPTDQPIRGAVPVTLEASLGRWQVEDRDPVEPGIQTVIEGGEVTYGLVASPREGLGELRVTTDQGSQLVEVAFVPAARPLIAAGLLQGRIDLRSLTKGGLVAAAPTDGFERELTAVATSSSDGLDRAAARGAVYLRGKIQGKYLLTAAYDSERDPDARLFRDIRPEEFYPVYGDASVREYGAQSSERLYVRVDRDRNYFLYGDFETAPATASRELGSYLRTLTGAVQHLESEKVSATAFATRSRANQLVEELPGRGVSGPYALSRADGLINSERVELVTRDRNQPSRILKLEPQRRYADYSLEPFTGRILFRRPIPSVDGDLNPISIRVSYEIERGGESFWIVGADAQVALGRRVELGAGVVNEDDPLAPFRLFTLNGTAALGQGTTLTGEWARTDLSGVEGTAGRIEFRHASRRFDFYAYGAESGLDFANRSSTFQPGRRELGARGGLALDERTRIRGEWLRSESKSTGGSRDGALLALERQFGRQLRWEVGYRHGSETIQPVAPSTVAATPNSSDALHLRVTWDLLARDSASSAGRGRRGSVFAEFDQDLTDSDQRRGAIGADYLLTRRLRVFGRHEFLSSFAGPYALNQDQRSQATVFGFDAGYGDDGQVFSEYRLRDGVSGRDGEAVIGLRNRWTLARGVRFDASFERINRTAGTTRLSGEGTAIAGALEYSANPLWRGTARLEYRDDQTVGGTWLGTLGYARKISSDWTTLGRVYWNDLGNDQLRTRAQIGLAWRQTPRSDWNGLARYERIFERLGAVSGSGLSTHGVDVVSAHLDWRATDGLSITGRWAAKWAADSLDRIETSSRAMLGMIRGIQDLGRSWDVAGTVSSLSANQGGGRRFGLGIELGRRLVDDLRLGLGYNVFGFRDRDLRETEYTLKGIYLRLDYKFDERLFGGDERPSRPRVRVLTPSGATGHTLE